MTPASQHQDIRPSVVQNQSGDGSQSLTLKICECYLDQGKEDVEAILEEESEPATEDSGPVETDEKEHDKDDDEEDEETERLSLVNETGSCSGEEDDNAGGGGELIDQDDSIYQVQFPTSFVELDESRQSRRNYCSSGKKIPQQTDITDLSSDLTDSNRNEKNEKVEAWLNNDTSLKKQRKGILRRKSQLDDDIFQLRPSLASSEESFTRKIHPKYASLNVVKEFASPGEREGQREGERDLSGSSGGSKRKRVTVVEDDLIVPHKRRRPASPAQAGWLDYLPGWVSGFFR